MALLLSSCGTFLPDVGSVIAPEILEVSVTGITSSSATLTARVSDGSQVESGGFTIVAADGSETRDIMASIEGDAMRAEPQGLNAGSEYSVSAFISNGAGQKRSSSPISFKTFSIPDTPDIPENPSIKDAFFLAWLLKFYDADSDGTLSPEEAAMIGTIEINTDRISTLASLSFFPHLHKIHAEGTRFGDIGEGRLTELDASACSELQIIYVPHNHISSVTLPSVKTQLCNVAFCINELTAIDLRDYKSLDFVDVAYNRLGSIDLSGLDKLDELHLDHNPLKEITLENKMLRYIDINNTDLSVIDLSRCPKLDIADCSGCTYLKTIYLAKGQVIGTLRTEPGVTIIHYD